MRYWLVANAQAGNGHPGRIVLAELTARDLADKAWEQEIEAGDRVLVAGGDGPGQPGSRLLCVTWRNPGYPLIGYG